MSQADMPYLVGILLALVVAAGAGLCGLDRERGFYPTVLVVIASYYDLFAVIGGSAPVLGVETAITVIFIGAAIVGFKVNLWVVVAALVAHGLLDLRHASLIDNPGVPAWWPGFCLAYDLTAAGYLAWRLRRGVRSRSAS